MAVGSKHSHPPARAPARFRAGNRPVIWTKPRGPMPSRSEYQSEPSSPRPRGARVSFSAMPPAQGLYAPHFESDSCGVAFLADLRGRPSHAMVAQALTALRNLEHRGAAGAEPSSGDGAGLTVQVPDAFLRRTVAFVLPPKGEYAVGNAFLPTDDAERDKVVALVESTMADEGLTL